uniref:RNA-dependent RNA polymerase n=1 Tax=Red panda associated partitivirus TaxID=2864004 RepID=A0A8K1HJB8_9VIRU|nr:RNA-dependent RNA polymerase [Red panda associated partitivirus]
MQSLRNIFQEFSRRIPFEWNLFQRNQHDPEATQQDLKDSDYSRNFIGLYKQLKFDIPQAEFQAKIDSYIQRNKDRNRDFQFYTPLDPENAKIPESRLPAPGIISVPAFYHPGNVIRPNPETSRPLNPDNLADDAESYIPGDVDFGPPIHYELAHLIATEFPQYHQYVLKYCRPAGTTDATFRDFNKEQKPSAPVDDSLRDEILSHVDFFFNITPYLPLHYVDTAYAKLPLATGTGYHNRHSYKRRAYAHFMHPTLYADKPTSKGYFFNATKWYNRTIIHNIKLHGWPYPPPQDNASDEQTSEFILKMQDFFNSYPTMLFTRNHISDREKTLKVRPVYACDELFLDHEVMLTFPAHVQARKPSCCIMYGLETIRGSNHYIDRIARLFTSYATIDWSGYDQRLPWIIVRIFFFWLRTLIIISHGYAPTFEYPTYPDLTPDQMYERINNMLTFLENWYYNMTFLSLDGYAYRRTLAGVPSGLLNTQFLDSFGNVYIIIDALIAFGATKSEIRSFLLFIMGDDNSIFSTWNISRLDSFITFLEEYALKRWNMVLSKTKSVITDLRERIETLGYKCSYGFPTRDIGKLTAQLVFPEHGLKPQFMSARAIGIAYASCGQDDTFHEFCRRVYEMYLPCADLSQEALNKTKRWLFRLLEVGDLDQPLILDRFPRIDEIRNLISYYHGPLGYAPKWNYAHFKYDPDYAPSNHMTVHDYDKKNGLSHPEPIIFQNACL